MTTPPRLTTACSLFTCPAVDETPSFPKKRRSGPVAKTGVLHIPRRLVGGITRPVLTVLAVLLLISCALFSNAPAIAGGGPRIRVRFAKTAHAEPFTGRVYLFFSNRQREPRFGPNWFRPEPFASRPVRDWKPGTWLPVRLSDAEWSAFPERLDRLELGGMHVQAVCRFDPWDRRVGTGVGNGYSEVRRLPDDHDAAENGTASIDLTVDRLVPETPFPENRWCKLLRVRSERLSRFHGRNVFTQAAVLLPASYYDQPQRRFPVIFSIPGFSGTHRSGIRQAPVEENNPGGVEFIRVTLDPSCPWGHHVFADSQTNGPVGTALTEEFLPEFDRRFRSTGEPQGRFLTGHSSGGWSSLWLQVAYPETFNGVWSTSPDPVDFRDFQRINIYRGDNVYRERDGSRRPLARSDGRVLLWYDDFDRMEEVLGRGGQLRSFDAVFSPRGNDGVPLRLWSRQTGEINRPIAETWKAYDIRLILERDWDTLGPKLAGKLHVFTGDADTFYLDGAVRLLKESLEKRRSDAQIEIFSGRDHFNIYAGGLRERIRREMAERFLATQAAR